jgi:hypothetical protein
VNRTRNRGLLLLVTALLVFAGTSAEILPAEGFWAGLLTAVVGCIAFIKGNHEAFREAKERQVKERAATPGPRNQAIERFAEQQARAPAPRRGETGEWEATSVALPADELVLSEIHEVEPAAAEGEGDEAAALEVSSDVSFPVELQENLSLAEQLERLRRLREDGTISEEEFAVAKAKLLG